ncbi:MAG TPA: hypothetical protein PKA38_03605 [Candidatus Levybacteria bacterium]|nr:hypothetical protein [Candidatus Levybacteria bacterium]
MKLSYNSIGATLIEEIPEFTPIYKDHLSDYDEILPQVLFGDFTRFIIETFNKSKNDEERDELLSRCLNFIESLFESRDPKLEELAQVSFLENLNNEKEYNAITKRLGPISRQQLELSSK